METDPREIFRLLAQTVGRGIMIGNFELYASCVALPHRMVSFDFDREFADLAELRSAFYAITDWIASRNITHLVRRPTSARFTSDTGIEGTYESHYYDRTHELAARGATYCELERREGRWLITSCQFVLADAPELSQALREVAA